MLGCLVLVIGAVALFVRNDEPRHDGQSLSEWTIEIYAVRREADKDREERAKRALRAIGPSGFAIVVEQINRESPMFDSHPRAASLPVIGRHYLNSWNRKREEAWAAVNFFEALGPEAAEAIPLLKNSLQSQDPDARFRAAMCLLYIGEPAVPLLCAIASDPNHPACRQVLSAMCYDPHLKHITNTSALVPSLLVISTNRDAVLASRAVKALGNTAPLDVVLPIVTNAFAGTNRTMRLAAVHTFGRLRQHHYLDLALKDRDEQVRIAATNAINRVDAPDQADSAQPAEP